MKRYLYALMCLVIAFSCSGCIWQSADMTDIMKAQQYCADKGGLREINIHFSGFEKAYCINGNGIPLHRVELNVSK